MEDLSMIPRAAEPFFMTFGARNHMVPAMNSEGMRVGVERVRKNP